MNRKKTMADKIEAGTQYYVLFSAGSRIPTERELEALVEKTGAVIRVVAPGLVSKIGLRLETAGKLFHRSTEASSVSSTCIIGWVCPARVGKTVISVKVGSPSTNSGSPRTTGRMSAIGVPT